MNKEELEAYDAMMADRDRWRAKAEAAEKEAAQNWTFFEAAAKEKNRLLDEADSWKSSAIELASFIKPGWDDSDAALERFRQLRDA